MKWVFNSLQPIMAQRSCSDRLRWSFHQIRMTQPIYIWEQRVKMVRLFFSLLFRAFLQILSTLILIFTLYYIISIDIDQSPLLSPFISFRNINWLVWKGISPPKTRHQYPWVDKWLMTIFPLSGRVKSCKVSQEVWLSTLGQMSDPSLAWKKAMFSK